MKNNQLVRMENGVAFALSLYMYLQLDFPVGIFFVLLFVPDCTMIGYMVNKKVGASLYNVGHSFLLPLVLAGSYLYVGNDYLLMLSIIWAAHIFLDRLLGFGLKYEDSFNQTHIQRL
ncbi:DUF4260 domain-containing protein [Peribacillus psychrosaccharolyticus]|uniref:DUF4260 domain-containing protein n=1 Tax=Peribacillus psychrosaccharolyticus TaxID=1407 RepID=A0A974S0I3_PERPY|nr:DUF4260 domain-containing protein [Peribacillus psychrosaccharolyticus]MEC2056135.1 DUF4260 domain-containing protein [Peribacillus psychrosaccharolyticus]MED3745576.1 DUF4260 domain-containing protein [Peribacillus psychrosaccharolyticus]QQT00672.1 DUF4260 domain-containing protein [Peribacillus psychrosaccharolyticus]